MVVSKSRTSNTIDYSFNSLANYSIMILISAMIIIYSTIPFLVIMMTATYCIKPPDSSHLRMSMHNQLSVHAVPHNMHV